MRNPVFVKEGETRTTPEEYLAMERESEAHHGFIDGIVFSMTGESLAHSRIRMNLGGEVRNKLKGSPRQPLSPNMKVRTSAASLFAYPNLTIVCEEPIFHDKKKDVLVNPRAIFEVLSRSTEKFDRTTKFARFRMGNESLTDYILVLRTSRLSSTSPGSPTETGCTEVSINSPTLSRSTVSNAPSLFRDLRPSRI